MNIQFFPLGFPWQTQDPFLFCVFHQDFFPESNGRHGPKGSLAGRNIGNDFVIKDGFRMYHGDRVPGFPAHPHRGFETLTVVPQGLVDHADSLGGRGRYGNGDVQWMTAGRGVQHSEMFPLLDTQGPNTMVLFQIWLNLSAQDKMAPPDYKMTWAEDVPISRGEGCQITYYVGDPESRLKSKIPPNSWAAKSQSEVAVWQIELEPHSELRLPEVNPGVHRSLYCYQGRGGLLQERAFHAQTGTFIEDTQDLLLESQGQKVKFLLLQGRPIQEPVVQYGPFVMNTESEIQKAYSDFQKTQFGGWPWDRPDPVHAHQPRFAQYPDGTREEPESDN